MVVAFDIGNTNIHIGLYKGRTLTRKFVLPVSKNVQAAKIRRIFNDRRLTGAAIASVVPSLTKQVIELCKRYGLPAVVVSSRIDCGLKYAYRDPLTLGADRIAAVVGALTRYRRDAIVVDAGTAITIDVALRGGKHLGGVILPGMHMLSACMQRNTAQLPEVAVRKPKDLTGKSTEECIQSGIFNGTMIMVSGFIKELKRKYGKSFFCVSTGGSGILLKRYIKEIQKYDADLCMYGAVEIYHRYAS
ncbi:MAG: type III pantothenate kinase [candidate division WOR-3 bacterium]|nr:MAG: type III pantothenate kinase [candidate division WOR-3 bacterium]